MNSLKAWQYMREEAELISAGSELMIDHFNDTHEDIHRSGLHQIHNKTSQQIQNRWDSMRRSWSLRGSPIWTYSSLCQVKSACLLLHCFDEVRCERTVGCCLTIRYGETYVGMRLAKMKSKRDT